MTKRLTLVFFIAALVIGLALRLVSIASKQTWEWDESTFYLAASGHQAEFEATRNANAFPFAQWAVGSDWKHFITIDQPLAFGEIGYGMAIKDGHPPLFVWLLHVWILIVGVHPWTAPLLNLLLTVPMVALLFVLARRTLGSTSLALVVAGIWLLRPVPVDTLLLARNYTLFALMSILSAYLVWLLLYRQDAPRLTLPRALLLIVVFAAGLLTHFYFAPLVIGAGGLALLLRYGLHRKLFTYVGCAVAGGILFLLAHYNFLTYGTAVIDERENFDLRFLNMRLERVIGQTLGLYFDDVNIHLGISSFSRLVLPALVVVALGFVLLVLLYRRRAALVVAVRRIFARAAAWNRLYLWVFIAVVVGGQYFLYLAFISPPHAMNPRYVNVPWAFLVFVPVLLADMLRGRARQVGMLVLGVYCAGVLVSAVGLTMRGGVDAFPDLDLAPFGTLSEYDVLVVDNQFRELMTPLALHLDSEDRIIAARQTELLADPDLWLPALAEDGGLYVSVPADRGGTAEHQAALIALMTAQGLTVEPVQAPWMYETYRVTP